MARLMTQAGWKMICTALVIGVLAAACGGQASPTVPAPPPVKSAPAATPPAGEAASASAAAKAPPSTPVEIRLGHELANEEQIFLMKARPDLTPNQGKWYTLTYHTFSDNAQKMAGFQAGQLDGGAIPAATALFARAEALPLKVVAAICEENSKGFNTTFAVRADSGITSIADLKGKTVAIPYYKSAGDLWARVALKSAGLNPDRDVNIVVGPLPTMGESLRSQKVDVATLVEPFYDLEHAKGGVKDLFTSQTAESNDWPLLMLFLNENFIQKNPDVVRAFLADYVKVNQWYLANTKEGRQAVLDAKFVTSNPPSVYLDAKDYYRSPDARVSVEALSKLQDLMMQAGWLDKKVAGELLDMSYLPK